MLKALLKTLVTLQESVPNLQKGQNVTVATRQNTLKPDYGICVNVFKTLPFMEDSNVHEECMDKLKQLLIFWPKYSGNPEYAIPSLNPALLPRQAYEAYPKWTGAYGELRIDLLNHTIKMLEVEIRIEDKLKILQAAKTVLSSVPEFKKEKVVTLPNGKVIRASDSLCVCLQKALPHYPALRILHFALLQDTIPTWPKYSGNIIFPVPSPSKDMLPFQAYANTTNYWIKKYGKNRIKLLKYYIKELEANIAAEYVLRALKLLQTHVPDLQLGHSKVFPNFHLKPDQSIRIAVWHMTNKMDVVGYNTCNFQDLYHSWNKYSGDPNYPIKHLEGTLPAHVKNKWTGEYGALRVELLEHLISKLEKKILL